LFGWHEVPVKVFGFPNSFRVYPEMKPFLTNDSMKTT